ncbi:MAG: DNA repair protein RecO [Candidatus Moranbacteria bacterium]|nr:DNA repair protein RecO [Candidatus Moranbacteria bacterium]
MNDIYNSLAIVLRTFDAGEYDLFFSVLTRDFGKLKCTARGIKKMSSKNVYSLTVGSLVDLYFLAKKNASSYLVTGAKIDWKPDYLKNSFTKNKLLFSGIQLIDQLTLDEGVFDQDNFWEFDYLFNYLMEINRAKSYKKALIYHIYFVLKILDHYGFKPEFKKCIACSKSLKDKKIYYSFRDGAFVCENCLFSDFKNTQIKEFPFSALKAANFFMNNKAEVIYKLKLDKNILKALLEIVTLHKRYCLGF